METKDSWLKLMSKKEFDTKKSKYKIENPEVEKVVAQAKPTDALALRVTTGSGLKVLGVKILNEETPELFAELMSKGVDAI